MAGSNAHMIMNTPTPYGLKDLQSAPLNGEGYNFPCQSGSRADAFDATGVSNPMVVGQDNDLEFTGSAVHGGGSCQLSVTYEYPPPADKTKWKVIHSFIGSCPASAVGNIAAGDHPDDQGRPTGVSCTGGNTTECLHPFKFQIPEGMKNGNATLAWTWFNKVGNREMYMNCAPISISGGSDDDTFYNSLPDMFVANIPGECSTEDGSFVIGFPKPGKFVTYGEAFDPKGSGKCPAPGPGNSPSGSASGSSAATGSAVQTYPAASSYAASSTPMASSVSTYAPVASSAPASYAAAPTPESSYTMATVAVTAPKPSGTGYTSTSSGNSTSGACTNGKVSCPSPGDLMCIDETHFGICDVDFCAVPRQVASGTTCSNNSVDKRDVVRRRISRIHRHLPVHVHHRGF